MTHDEMICIVQIVGQLLLSDMALTAKESDFLESLMTRYELDADARSAVYAGVNVGDNPAVRVAELGADAKHELLGALKEAAAADGVVEPVEAKLIAAVEKAVAAGG